MTAPTAAQQRVITAAMGLFARHGVGGTSLQMIADEIGVTKAAVYHQYPTKDEIVFAVAESELDRLRAVVEVAEAQPPDARRDALLAGIVDQAVDTRRSVGTLLNDPKLTTVFAGHEPFRDVMTRMRTILVGDDGHEADLQAIVLTAAISGAVLHPMTAGLDDDVLREQLLALGRRFLRGPAAGTPPGGGSARRRRTRRPSSS